MRTRTPGQAAKHHRLLPHERWFADYGARRGPAPEGSDRWRMQQNYGPEGMALLGAASLDGTGGGFIGVIGIVTLAAGAPTVAAYLIVIGVLIALFGMVRAIQCGRAGRIYRDGRPFIHATGRR